jgi:transposase-like protein
MEIIRKKHSAKFKADVALEALKGDKTINEIGADFKVHPDQLSQWKKRPLEGIRGVFGSKQGQEGPSEILYPG